MNRTLLVALAMLASAADWPQWRGPNRDEISKETGLLKAWPKDGPRVLWTLEQTGIGYSGPAIVGDKLYIVGATGEDAADKEFLLCVDTAKGSVLWKQEFGKGYKNNWGGGPRGNPSVDGDRVYAIGPNGDIVCMESASGKIVWEKNFIADLGGKLMSGWGYSESPLVDGKVVICTPGGSKGTLAALDKLTGDVVWRSTDLTDSAGYSSVVIGEGGGVRQYVQQTDKGVVGIKTDDGKLLWKNVCPNYRTAVIPTPIVHEDYVYVTSGYGAGCTLVKLSSDGSGGVKAEEIYKNKNMINHHGGVVLVDGHVYGYSDGRGWVCQNLLKGENAWEAKRRDQLEKGSLTCVDGELYCYGESSGQLVRIKATPEGWKELSRFKLPRETKIRKPAGKIWTHPVVANGKLYLRDQDLLFCFDLKDSQARK